MPRKRQSFHAGGRGFLRDPLDKLMINASAEKEKGLVYVTGWLPHLWLPTRRPNHTVMRLCSPQKRFARYACLSHLRHLFGAPQSTIIKCIGFYLLRLRFCLCLVSQ